MKIKIYKNEHNRLSCENCGAYGNMYHLDGWGKDDWLCADCFLSELIESEADYQVIPKNQLKKKK